MTYRRLCERVSGESGVALVIALMAMSLMLALALALTLTTMTEARVAANHERGVEAEYAAAAGVERVLRELRAAPDWDPFLNGTTRSSFVDGSHGGVDLVPVTAERPWGPNNPIWQPIAYGPLNSLAPAGMIDSLMYVIVWIGDDPSENDGDPLRDGAPPVGCHPESDPSCADTNPGRGVVEVMAQAIGPDGTRRTIEVTLSRGHDGEEGVVAAGGRVVSWRDDD